jgi:hypothetical protein
MVTMDENEAGKERIYIDDTLPATLRYDGRTVTCATLHEAVNAWRKLPNDLRADATIKVDVEGGNLYQGSEIARLYRRPPSTSASNFGSERSTLKEKEFTAPTLEGARDQTEQWLAQQNGIKLIRQKQASDFGPGGHDVRWTVTLYYKADGNEVLPKASDEGVGTV